MRRHRSSRRLAAMAAVLVVIGVGGLLRPVAHAESEPPVVATGWWSKRPLAQPVADGGFAVSWALEEQSAAAVRIDLSTPLEGTVYLVLTEIGGAASDQGAMRVCVATESWEPANPGPYADLPASDCSPERSLELGRDGVALTWLGDISALVAAASGPTLDLVVHPMPKPVSADVPASVPFEVQLSGASVLVDPSSTPTTDPGPVTTLPPFDGTDGSVDPGSFVPDLGGGFDVPTVPPVSLPPNATTTTRPSAPEDLALGPIDVTDGETKPWVRLLWLTPISAGLGTAAAALRRLVEERALERGAA